MREAFNVRLEAAKLIDLCFLNGFDKPVLCMLFETNKKTRVIKLFSVDCRNRVLTPSAWDKSSAIDPSTYMLIPGSREVRGVFLVASTSVTYMNGTGVTQIVSINPGRITASAPSSNTQTLLCDHTGKLFVLTAVMSGGSVMGLACDFVGSTIVASSICVCGNGLAYIGSTIGDSQLIALPFSHSKEEFIRVISTGANLGPILDMCVVQSEGHGQTQVNFAEYLSGVILIF
jgi:DNA damage-binding protein 1